MKQITTLDPISMHDVVDIDNAPFVIEGEGNQSIKIYFESEANKAEYLNMPLPGPGDDLSAGKPMSGHSASGVAIH